MITTKRGKEGMKPTLNVTYNHSFAQPTRIVEMADAATYAVASNYANDTKGLPHLYTDEDIQLFRDGLILLVILIPIGTEQYKKHGLIKIKRIYH